VLLGCNGGGQYTEAILMHRCCPCTCMMVACISGVA
jgi:hypothetical protein